MNDKKNTFFKISIHFVYIVAAIRIAKRTHFSRNVRMTKSLSRLLDIKLSDIFMRVQENFYVSTLAMRPQQKSKSLFRNFTRLTASG